MSDWWATGEWLMSDWWVTDERLINDNLLMIKGLMTDGRTEVHTDGQRWLLSRYRDWKISNKKYLKVRGYLCHELTVDDFIVYILCIETECSSLSIGTEPHVDKSDGTFLTGHCWHFWSQSMMIAVNVVGAAMTNLLDCVGQNVSEKGWHSVIGIYFKYIWKLCSYIG